KHRRHSLPTKRRPHLGRLRRRRHRRSQTRTQRLPKKVSRTPNPGVAVQTNPGAVQTPHPGSALPHPGCRTLGVARARAEPWVPNPGCGMRNRTPWVWHAKPHTLGVACGCGMRNRTPWVRSNFTRCGAGVFDDHALRRTAAEPSAARTRGEKRGLALRFEGTLGKLAIFALGIARQVTARVLGRAWVMLSRRGFNREGECVTRECAAWAFLEVVVEQRLRAGGVALGAQRLNRFHHARGVFARFGA